MTKKIKKTNDTAPHRTVEQYEADKLAGKQPIGYPVSTKD